MVHVSLYGHIVHQIKHHIHTQVLVKIRYTTVIHNVLHRKCLALSYQIKSLIPNNYRNNLKGSDKFLRNCSFPRIWSSNGNQNQFIVELNT